MGTAFNSSICLTFFVAGSIASRNELKRCIRSRNEALLELGIGEPLEAAFAARRSGVAGVVSASFTLSSVQPFPITTQSLIGSPQACERALDVLHRIRAGVTWWAKVIQKQAGPPPGATAWLLWYQYAAATPSLVPSSSAVTSQAGPERWVLTIGVPRIMDGLHLWDMSPDRQLLRR